TTPAEAGATSTPIVPGTTLSRVASASCAAGGGSLLAHAAVSAHASTVRHQRPNKPFTAPTGDPPRTTARPDSRRRDPEGEAARGECAGPRRARAPGRRSAA